MDSFVVEARQSEIATMMYVRESGLYPDIPVPSIYAWDFTCTNAAGTPYVLMEVMPGRNLQALQKFEDGWRQKGLDALDMETQIGLTESMATLHARLSCPPKLDNLKIGSILRTDDGGYEVGPLYTTDNSCLGGPFDSVQALWRSMLKKQVLHAMKEWHRREHDRDIWIGGTPQEFSHLLQLLSALIPHFVPAEELLLKPVLHHPDLALRNILVDEQDPTKITAVLDWSGAQILPSILTCTFPDDLMSYPDDPPIQRNDGNPWDQGWLTVPFDWTSFNDSNKWMRIYQSAGKVLDLQPRASVMIRRYYLRQYYSATFGQAVVDFYGSIDLGKATLFMDAPYYLKFNEVICGGYGAWYQHAQWIKETYWRLRNNPLSNNEKIVVGPNIYRTSTTPLFRDLTLEAEGSSPHKLWTPTGSNADERDEDCR